MQSPQAALSKYWKTAVMAATSLVGDTALFLVDYVIRFLRVAVLLSLWRMVLPRSGATEGMTLGAALTYTLVSQAFAEQLLPKTELQTALWEGSIATRMLQPVGVVAQFTADMAGRWLFGLIFFTLPLLLCAPLLGVSPLPVSPAAGALFLVSLALGVSVGVAVEFLFAGVMVAAELNMWAVQRFRSAVALLLSGLVLPLQFFPWGLGRLFQWLPFAAMASAPLRIYTGTGSALPLLLMQAAWCAVLWPAVGALWGKSREKLVSYGG